MTLEQYYKEEYNRRDSHGLLIKSEPRHQGILESNIITLSDQIETLSWVIYE